MIPIVLATTNLHKIAEYHDIISALPGLDWQVTCLESPLPEMEETGISFRENSILKAHYYSQFTHLPLIADDSGLVIDALNGEPGIYSARYRGEKTSYSERFDYIFRQLADIPTPQRTAHFACVITYTFRDCLITAEGYCQGLIASQPAGHRGFGYDPIFYLPDYQCTMAELSTHEKNNISHRYHAMQKLAHHIGHHSRP